MLREEARWNVARGLSQKETCIPAGEDVADHRQFRHTREGGPRYLGTDPNGDRDPISVIGDLEKVFDLFADTPQDVPIGYRIQSFHPPPVAEPTQVVHRGLQGGFHDLGVDDPFANLLGVPRLERRPECFHS